MNGNHSIDVSSMSQAELKELRAKLDFFITPDKDNRKNIEILLACLSEAYDDRVGAKLPPLKVIMSTSSAKSFKEGVEAFESFIAEHLQPKDQRERVYAYRILCDSLCRYVLDAGQPLNMRILLARMKEIASAINSDFPGYAAAGLLRLIYRPRKRNGE